MSKPNSLTTRIRMLLVEKLDPRPDAGEAWCMDCSINNDRTIVVPADGLQKHVNNHPDGDHVQVRATWPS